MRELLDRIGRDEFLEWMDYYQIEPWGEWRADLRTGIVASTVANVFRGKGKSTKPQDFMPKFGSDSKPVSNLAQRLNAMFRDPKKRKGFVDGG